MQQRIGHLVPSTSIGVERWAAQICKPVAIESAHAVARASLPEIMSGPAIAPSQSGELTRAATQLADAGVRAVVWSGSSADLHGAAHGRAMARWIEQVTGVRASTVTLGQLDLLARRDIVSLALVSPGSEQTAGRLADTYLAAGFKISSITALGLSTAREAAELPVSRVRRMLLDADSLDAQCLVVAGTELPVAPVAALVERELGKPVYDGARVAVYTGLELLGLSVTAPEWGEMFGAPHPAGVCCDTH
ncbi:aspartate racemase/maleate isomerase family protein [Streptomyces sp. NPDC054863]